MKTILLICCSLFLFLSKAEAQTGLESAIQDLDYALNVEWDQVDEAFYQKQEALFVKRLSYLKKQGLANAEVAEFLSQKISNQQIVRDIQDFFNLVDGGLMSSEGLSLHLRFLQSQWYKQGASWNGSVVGVATIATLAVIASAVMVTTPLFQLY